MTPPDEQILLSLAVPLASAFRSGGIGPKSPHQDPSGDDSAGPLSGAGRPDTADAETAGAGIPIDLGATGRVVVVVYAGYLVLKASRLAIAWRRTAILVRRSSAAPPSLTSAAANAGVVSTVDLRISGGAAAPTHVVFSGRAWRLGAEAVQIGTELGETEYGIHLGGRAQAVSRRHCSIQQEDGRVMVHDQSRYGTLLNGHRIAGSAVLQAGDVLSLGQPPLEFALIAEVCRGT